MRNELEKYDGRYVKKSSLGWWALALLAWVILVVDVVALSSVPDHIQAQAVPLVFNSALCVVILVIVAVGATVKAVVEWC
jgi:hypothetical protein